MKAVYSERITRDPAVCSMKIYSHHGFNDFVICLGYKGYCIKEYFAHYFLHESDITFDFRSGNQQVIHNHSAEPWQVTLVNTGLDTMTGGRTAFHVDVEAGEVNNRVIGCRPIITHLHPFLSKAMELAKNRDFPDRAAWKGEIAELRVSFPDVAELQGIPGINPNDFMHSLSAASTQAAAFTVDVGQHQMWAGQSLELLSHQRFLTSGGMGSMGFALPAAMACPGRPVVMLAGDGGFQLNIQELQTVAHHRLPVKMVVINNNCYGMVRQFQQSYFDERYQSTCWGYSAPDFAKVARAYAIEARAIRETHEVKSALQWLWSDPAAPALLDVTICGHANVYPKIAFGRPMTDMEPDATPTEMEGT